MSKPIVAVAFDGVVAIVKRWPRAVGEGSIDAILVAGSRGWLSQAVLAYEVHLVDPRAGDDRRGVIVEWLLANIGEVAHELQVSAAAPVGTHVTLDARAVTFNGRFPRLNELVEHCPWWETALRTTPATPR